MIHLVDKSRVSMISNWKTELITKASDIGLSPGDWPLFIAVLDEKKEGFLFVRGRTIEGGGHCYQSKNGRITLVVLND